MRSAERVATGSEVDYGIDVGDAGRGGLVAASAGSAVEFRIKKEKVSGRFAVDAQGVVEYHCLHISQIYKVAEVLLGGVRQLFPDSGEGLVEGKREIRTGTGGNRRCGIALNPCGKILALGLGGVARVFAHPPCGGGEQNDDNGNGKDSTSGHGC